MRRLWPLSRRLFNILDQNSLIVRLLLLDIVLAAFYLSAAICYYAVDIDQHLSEIKADHPPLLLHFGDHNKFVLEQAIKIIRSAFTEQEQALLYVDPKAGHGFTTEKGKRHAEKST